MTGQVLSFKPEKKQIVVREITKSGRRIVGRISRNLKYVECEGKHIASINAYIASVTGAIQVEEA